MDEQQDWVEALNINPENLTKWGADARDGTPLLVRCLVQGHVKVADYLQWAQKNYGLPVLDARFFREAFDFELFDRMRAEGEWAAWCFPISEWDDVTIVACVEPPNDKPPGHYAFVLADPNELAQVWNEGKTTVMTEGMSESLADVANEAPAGINLTSTAIFKLDLSNLGGESADTPPPPKKARPAVPPVLAPPIAASAPPPPRPSPLKATPSAPQPQAATPTSSADEFQGAIVRLKQHFAGALIMHNINNELKPYAWDSALKVANDARNCINLFEPSFFRIVAKTNKPYHGYVVESEMHKKFFSSLHLNEVPACVTAVPIKQRNLLWGILLCYGSDNVQTPENLQIAQVTAKRLMLVLAQEDLNAA